MGRRLRCSRLATRVGFVMISSFDEERIIVYDDTQIRQSRCRVSGLLLAADYAVLFVMIEIRTNHNYP